MPLLPISLLDLAPVGAGHTPSAAIRESIALAQHADRLGFTRYWVAEHHNLASVAASAPEVLIAHIAAVTQRIRVGAGGIMLPNHSPLRVVEIFRTLEALHPDRIDLGLGRAPGTDPVTSAALRRAGDGEVNDLLAELLAFANHGFPAGHPFATIEAMPTDARLPPIWMLGSTLAGAQIGAALGARYAFAGHFAMSHARAALEMYRAKFRPSADLAAPYAMLAVTVVCGEDDAHAQRLAAPIRVAIAHNRTGRRQPILSIEDALAYNFTPQERAIADEFLAGAVIGGPARVRDELHRLATDLGADEIMASGMISDPADRRAACTRLAATMELPVAPMVG